MTDNYKEILAALVKEGFHQLPGQDPQTGKALDFKITPYSLNTKLSFRFENLDHLIEFLKRSGAESEKRIEVLHTTFIELGLDPAQFFWVNFFEKGKEEEM